MPHAAHRALALPQPTPVELADICAEVHWACGDECPVFAANGDRVPLDAAGQCACFKDGAAMAGFLALRAWV